MYVLRFIKNNEIQELKGWSQEFFVTQSEYDALPSTKNSDDNSYSIVDCKVPLIDLIDVFYSLPDFNFVPILNEYRQDYFDYYLSKGYLRYEDWSVNLTVPAWKHLYTWTFTTATNSYQICDTDMTVNEIQTMASYISAEQANSMVEGEWYRSLNHLQ